ncbi:MULTISPECIES: hypothetical protein [Amycolatopsis]|uniref:hypothetical protein n=1 Tax=Amycolatopsis TaxID=1813 RepID=UPI001C578A98|nr:hypothetical protein [Amycolatopsis sp. TNS106]QXV59949.1 hypothetical protein CVV72_25025 [Amycolatopsis sp. TNS106]
MTDNGDEALPGLAPGARGFAGTLFAALHGEFTPHPWRAPGTDRDAYLVFYERSVAMGWLREDGPAGLWGMNDAGREHPPAETSLVAWFQVEAEPVPGDRPLPVQPFLRCASDAVARMGDLRLDAVQVLLPVQCLDTAPRPELARSPSLLTKAWFDDSAPTSRTPVRVTLDGGRSPTVLAVADRLATIDQDVFACESYADGQSGLRPPFDDDFWNGPPQHAVTFHGTLAEWTPDAVGWLAGLLADLSARHDVDGPLLFTASRA